MFTDKTEGHTDAKTRTLLGKMKYGPKIRRNFNYRRKRRLWTHPSTEKYNLRKKKKRKLLQLRLS